MKLLFPKREKKEFFLALDIGTETIKATLLKKIKEKVVILGVSLQYFDRFGVFDSKDFEADIIKKTILKAMAEVQQQAKVQTRFTLISPPANILKGKVITQVFKRKEPKKIIDKKEERTISQQIFKEAQKKISQIYAVQMGILSKDIQFLNSKILEIKIDGYRVPSLPGYYGENLDFKILTTFLPRDYLENFQRIAQDLNLEILNFAHKIWGLFLYLIEKPKGIFLDIGGETTQIFLAKEGILEQIDEFKMGGEAFSRALSERLGLGELRARILKERYSQKVLSKESQERIKEIFEPTTQAWFKILKEKLKGAKSLLPDIIFLFGGGSLLPEIQEILENGNWENLPFTAKPQVQFLYPKNLKNIEDKTGKLNNPQYTPLLLFYHYASKDF